jgi:hypothetical protein
MTDQTPAGGSDLLYGFLAGRQLGYARSDAGYFRRGTRAVRGRPGRWAMRPGWQRQMFRLGSFAAAGGSWAAYVAAPQLTASAAAALAALGSVKGARAGRAAWRMRKFRRMYTRPTLSALQHALGGAHVELHIDPSLSGLAARLAPPMSEGEREWRARYAKHVEPLVRWAPDQAWRVWTRAKRWADEQFGISPRLDRWRRPAEDHGPSITFATPSQEWWPDDQRANIAAIIAGKVPVADLAPPRWDTVGPTVRARWTVRKRPPSKVGRADFEARTARLPEYEYWLGLASGDQSTKISLKADSPHIGISGASGSGKSVLAMLLIVQTLQRGGEVYILDIKGSHRWALGLPGVTYCRTDQEIHDAWVKLGALARRRNDQAFDDPEAEKGFRRVLVVAEELNGMMDALADYWADERETAKERDPAMRGMRDILRMGRSALVNIVAIAQRLSAAASGNGDARENLGSALCLARFSANTWRMLCEGIPMPQSSSVPGRWFIVAGGKATETQVCFLDEWDARLLVLASAPAPASSCPAVRGSALEGDNQEMSAGRAPQADSLADPLSELLTLKEAADRRVIPWNAEAARKRFKRAAERDPQSVPQTRGKRGQGDLFTLGDLIVWANSERVK